MVAMAGIAVILFSLLGGAFGKRYGLPTTMIFGQLALLLALLWIAVRRFDFRSTLRIYPIGWDTVGWSMMVGIIFWPVVAGTSALIDRWLSLIGPGPPIPKPTSFLDSAIYAATLILLAPVTEEPIFRGIVLRAWSRRGTVFGLVVTSVLFAAFHFELAALIPATFFGIGLGLLVQRSNSLFSSVVAHMSYNVVGTLYLVIPRLRRTPDSWIMAAGAMALPLIIVVLWWFTRRFHAPTGELPPPEKSSGFWAVFSLLVVLGFYLLSAISIRFAPSLAGH
jgi:membrane protease YdiL (CAAX protease family)